MVETERRHASRASIITIEIEEGTEGLLYATSPELPGMLVAERDLERLTAEIPRVIVLMFRAKGEDVRVLPARRPATDRTLSPTPWVAIPADIIASSAVC